MCDTTAVACTSERHCAKNDLAAQIFKCQQTSERNLGVCSVYCIQSVKQAFVTELITAFCGVWGRALRHDMLAAIIAGVQLFDERGGIQGWYRGAQETWRDQKALPIYSNVEVISFEASQKSCIFQV
jgi:hypothetical protein